MYGLLGNTGGENRVGNGHKWQILLFDSMRQARCPSDAHSFSRFGWGPPTLKGEFSISSARGACRQGFSEWKSKVGPEVFIIMFYSKERLLTSPHSKPRDEIFLVSVFFVLGTGDWLIVNAQYSWDHKWWWAC